MWRTGASPKAHISVKIGLENIPVPYISDADTPILQNSSLLPHLKRLFYSEVLHIKLFAK